MSCFLLCRRRRRADMSVPPQATLRRFMEPKVASSWAVGRHPHALLRRHDEPPPCQALSFVFLFLAVLMITNDVPRAKNIVNYLRIIHKILAPDGVWINMGPLLRHRENNTTNDPSRARLGSAFLFPCVRSSHILSPVSPSARPSRPELRADLPARQNGRTIDTTYRGCVVNHALNVGVPTLLHSAPRSDQAGQWDAILTCFFIDTAKNIDISDGRTIDTTYRGWSFGGSADPGSHRLNEFVLHERPEVSSRTWTIRPISVASSDCQMKNIAVVPFPACMASRGNSSGATLAFSTYGILRWRNNYRVSGHSDRRSAMNVRIRMGCEAGSSRSQIMVGFQEEQY
ncbi:hypothetical protein DFH09DRAFT_1285996 [Mycena vulgaris]|nr:hypothetical protein DFH09DRAFT_1285996 [Mycena vulgaris]